MDNPLQALQTMRANVLKVLLLCLAKAEPEDTTWFDGIREIAIPKDSFVSSQEEMAEYCHLKRLQVRNALITLVEAGYVSYLRAHRNSRAHSLVIIENKGKQIIEPVMRKYRKTHPEA